MVRQAVVCLLLGSGLSACDVPPETLVAQKAVAAATSEKDCGCGKGEDCPAEAQPVPAASYQKVNVDGAPTAVFQRGRLGDTDRRAAEEALVTVAVFSDYECPYCARGDATLAALASEYGDRLRVVMKQMPLAMHPNARNAALAALAAGDQGRYWEMHEKLFANGRQLDPASLEKYAQALGLDLARFRASMASPAHQERITRDMAEAAALGVRGTPAFFINGRKISGARSAGEFQKVIGEELRRAEQLVSSGVPRARVYAKLMESASP